MMGKVEDVTQAAADEVAEFTRMCAQEMIGRLQIRCESPIERIMAAQLVLAQVPTYFRPQQWLPYPTPHVVDDASLLMNMTCPEHGFEVFGVAAQVPLLSGKYRADFVIRGFVSGERRPVTVVIECDGHDFHERTKKQAARDRSRDREMQDAGYTVLRFTGSEIFRDPIACRRDVESILQRRAMEIIDPEMLLSGWS